MYLSSSVYMLENNFFLNALEISNMIKTMLRKPNVLSYYDINATYLEIIV